MSSLPPTDGVTFALTGSWAAQVRHFADPVDSDVTTRVMSLARPLPASAHKPDAGPGTARPATALLLQAPARRPSRPAVGPLPPDGLAFPGNPTTPALSATARSCQAAKGCLQPTLSPNLLTYVATRELLSSVPSRLLPETPPH